jgi:integrase
MARKNSKDRGLFEKPSGSGIWWVCYFDAFGRRHREKAGSKGFARRLYEKRKTEIREARYFPPERRKPVMFEEILEDYRQAAENEQRGDGWGPERYRRLQEGFRGQPAGVITPLAVEAFRDKLSRDHAPANVNRHLQLLRAVFLRAIRDGKVDSAPTSKVRFYRENNKRERYLSNDEERRLFEVLPSWLHPLVTVALHTGMRKSELLKLKWSDVDFSTGTIHIRDPKSGEDEHVLMNETTKRALRALSDSRTRVVALKDRALKHLNRHVFVAPEGGYIHVLNRYWYPSLRRAGIIGLRFHDLRHTFASRAAMSGVDLYTLQTLMRHRSPQMTQRYAHLSAAYQREAIRLLDSWQQRSDNASDDSGSSSFGGG